MMLGNIFSFIATFFCIALTKHITSKPPSNEYGVGYYWGTFFLVASFALSGLILTIIILATEGFGWVYPTAGRRITLVLLYWLFIVLTMFYCAHFKWEWHRDKFYPTFLRVLARSYGQLWIPMLWLGMCLLSHHAEWQSDFSPLVMKVIFWLGFGISTAFTCGLIIAYAGNSLKRFKIKMARRTEQGDSWHQKNLDTIAAHTPQDPMVNLLSYSSRNRPNDIRQAALAKIKAHHNWEEELLRLLNHKVAYKEVYYFIDGNPVTRPQLFAEPLNQSIVWMAETIKTDIKGSNSLPTWSYNMYGIDHLLSAIDYQFLGLGVDFYPNVLALKQALHTTPPERFKGVRFTVTKVVDKWLKKHKK